jgi:oligogalacturonide lyase
MKPAHPAERGLKSASTNASRESTEFDEIRLRAGRSGLKPALLAGFAAVCATACVAQESSAPAAKLRDEWVDADTGHRVVRLSRIPGESESFYFHQNAFTERGDKMVFANPPGREGRRLFVLDWQTRKIEPLTDRPSGSGEVVGPKTRQVFYLSSNVLCSTHLDTRKTKVIATLPPGWRGVTVNADETLVAGSFGEAAAEITWGQPRSYWFNAIHAAHLPHLLFTVETKTGRTNVFHRGNDWFNHLQFSPTDPTLLQFCHEGPWHLLDRIWHIRTDGSGLRLVHKRTRPMEIAGHEFWSPDGKTAWFDLQAPKGETFFLAGFEVAHGQTTRYPIERDQWSVHFNISRDGKLFAGDGGAPNMVARAQNGKWIYLFAPQANETLKAEKLVNMAKHDYSLEPNANFTPDGKWIVFRGNFDGSAQVYAVEVAKAATH